MTTPETLTHLLQVCEAASPGPWRWLNNHGLMGDYGHRRMIITCSSHNRTPYLAVSDDNGLLAHLDSSKPNPVFMETFNPATMKPILLALLEYRKALEFYSNPEKWMLKDKHSWRESSPKSHGDKEIIKGYKHPGKDWVGSVVVGGNYARETLASVDDIFKQINERK